MSNTNTQELPSYENYRKVSSAVPKQISIYAWTMTIDHNPYDFSVIASSVYEAREEVLSILEKIDSLKDQWDNNTDYDSRMKLIDDIPAHIFQGCFTDGPCEFTSQTRVNGNGDAAPTLIDFIRTNEPDVYPYRKVFISSCLDG